MNELPPIAEMVPTTVAEVIREVRGLIADLREFYFQMADNPNDLGESMDVVSSAVCSLSDRIGRLVDRMGVKD